MKEPEDIKNINLRIRDFKTKHIDISKVSESQKNTYSQTTVGFQISVELLSGVLIGAGIGYLLDNLFSTRPWLVAIFTILGGAAGVLNIYKTFRVENKPKE